MRKMFQKICQKNLIKPLGKFLKSWENLESKLGVFQLRNLRIFIRQSQKKLKIYQQLRLCLDYENRKKRKKKLKTLGNSKDIFF